MIRFTEMQISCSLVTYNVRESHSTASSHNINDNFYMLQCCNLSLFFLQLVSCQIHEMTKIFFFLNSDQYMKVLDRY